MPMDSISMCSNILLMSIMDLHRGFTTTKGRHAWLQPIITMRRQQDTNQAALVWCADTSSSNMHGNHPTTSKDSEDGERATPLQSHSLHKDSGRVLDT